MDGEESWRKSVEGDEIREYQEKKKNCSLVYFIIYTF